MRIHNNRAKMVIATGAALLASLTACGSSGGAKTTTDAVRTASSSPPTGDQVLTFYLTSANTDYLTSAGKSFTPSATNLPKPGDSQVRTDLLYPGDHTKYAPNWTATDHQKCVFDRQGDANCQAEVAIGGSMILSAVTLGAPSATVRETITGGTGAYQGITGTVVFTSASANSSATGDLTITVHRT